MKLAHLHDLCYRAHSGTSFSPDQRAKYYVAEYSSILESDLATLPDEYRAEYEHKFVSLFTAWMHRKSNCISWMITGPSNFPTRRAEKANKGEDKAFQIFSDWRDRALTRKGVPKVKITLDMELEKAISDLATRERNQVQMKRVNELCRKKNAAELLAADGWKPALIHEFLNPAYSFYGKGYAKFELTNNNAQIKRLRDRVDMLTAKVLKREEEKETGEQEVLMFPGGQVVTNRVEDRVQFIFEDKPNRETIALLKSAAFKWSPNNGAWQRKITGNCFYAARQILKELRKVEA